MSEMEKELNTPAGAETPESAEAIPVADMAAGATGEAVVKAVDSVKKKKKKKKKKSSKKAAAVAAAKKSSKKKGKKKKKKKKKKNKLLLILLIILLVLAIAASGVIAWLYFGKEDKKKPTGTTEAKYDKLSYNSEWAGLKKAQKVVDKNNYTLKKTGDYPGAVLGNPNEGFIDPNFIVVNGELTQYLGKASTVTIPSHVKVIGKGLQNNKSIKKVIVPYTVTEISSEAFKGCTNLTRVQFTDAPSGEESKYSIKINEKAFAGTGGAEVKSDDKVTGYVDGITTINFPNYKVNLAKGTFKDVKHLLYVSFRGSDVNFTDGGIFDGVPDYLQVFFNDTLVGSQLVDDFAATYSLSDTSPYHNFMVNGDVVTSYNKTKGFVIHPDGRLIKYLGVKTANKDEIKFSAEITLPTAAKVIVKDAFKDTTGVTKVTVPYYVTHIENFAFNNASINKISFENAPSEQNATYPLTVEADFLGGTSVTSVTYPSRKV